MLAVKYDTMLIIIHIRRILESPSAVLDRHRDNAVVLPCRMIHPPRITHIFHTQKTFRITALFCQLCRRDRLRIFLRLGQIDRHIQIAVLCWRHPLLILYDPIASDIIGILT